MNLHQHIVLLRRVDRALALRSAIFETVKPGDRVLDAGCGTGLLTVWAVQAGAAHVVAVDTGNLDATRLVLEANSVADRVELVQGDVASVDTTHRFDVIFGLLYHNDPRRDEAQSRMVESIRATCLAEGGTLIPDRVEYTCQVNDWTQEDYWRRTDALDRELRTLSQRYGVDLDPLGRLVTSDLNRDWFPARDSTGAIDRTGARPLGPAAPAWEIRYPVPWAVPHVLRVPVNRPGVANVIVWAQRLFAGTRLVKWDESVTWLGEPVLIVKRGYLDVRLDLTWRERNVAYATFVAESDADG